jgi:hypothetical protein
MTPFYLRLRNLMLLESALREVDTNRLYSMVNNMAGGGSNVFDAAKERLVVAELSRRRGMELYHHRAPSGPPDPRFSFLPPVPAP